MGDGKKRNTLLILPDYIKGTEPGRNKGTYLLIFKTQQILIKCNKIKSIKIIVF